MRWLEVQYWFAGLPVYGGLEHADYPPASYVMLWPALGWLDVDGARWLWAASTAAVLAVFCGQLLRGSTAFTRREQAFMILLPLASLGTAASVRLGQVGLHVMVMTLAGVLILKGTPSWRRDVIAAACLLPTLIKPTLSVPFFVLAMMLPTGLRPVVLASVAYGLVTLLAATFQPGDVGGLLELWLQQRGDVDTAAGHGNLHAWLGLAGLGDWMGLGSLGMLGVLALWIWSRRHADLWLLLGVTAIVARMFAHHRHYDDVLLLIPMVSLLRGAHQDGPGNRSRLGLGLLALLWACHVAPARILSVAAPWGDLFKAAKTTAAIGTLMFLIARSARSPRVTTTP